MKSPTIKPLEIYRVKYSEEEIRESFNILIREIDKGDVPIVRFVSLGSVDVRIKIYNPDFLPTIHTYLGFSLKEEVDAYDYTIIIWRTEGIKTEPNKIYQIINRDTEQQQPALTFYEGGVSGFDIESKIFYCGYPNCSLERLTLTGSVFVRQFYRILKERLNNALVHSACVGIDGKGVLIGARGGRGKSTLAVSALLKGFDFVADDYLVIESLKDKLTASPIYSIVKLSHYMYDRMGDKIADAEILYDISGQEKYMLNISRWHTQFRGCYPIRLCLLPEIVTGLEAPSIIKCTSEEKMKGIVHMAQSTVSQLMDIYDNSGSLKLVGMLHNQDFYRIRLCSDIYRNVECLRTFLQNEVD